MMQFTATTATRYGLKDPHNVREALDAAARYVRDLQARFSARGDLILAAYNAGEGTVEAFRDGKRLVLPNNKTINPGSIRTGGVPPYVETREYVTRGKMVYENISREGLFQARSRRSVEGSLSEDAENKTTSEDAPRDGSIYSSEAGGKQPTQQTVKSAKSKGTAQMGRSIYVN
jgi:membrane-bound lytic murein transglycosylase MltF